MQAQCQKRKMCSFRGLACDDAETQSPGAQLSGNVLQSCSHSICELKPNPLRRLN